MVVPLIRCVSVHLCDNLRTNRPLTYVLGTVVHLDRFWVIFRSNSSVKVQGHMRKMLQSGRCNLVQQSLRGLTSILLNEDYYYYRVEHTCTFVRHINQNLITYLWTLKSQGYSYKLRH